MPAQNDNRPPKSEGLDQQTINLIVAGVCVVLLGVMIWLARELTHASDVIDCATRGLRNCG